MWQDDYTEHYFLNKMYNWNAIKEADNTDELLAYSFVALLTIKQIGTDRVDESGV